MSTLKREVKPMLAMQIAKRFNRRKRWYCLLLSWMAWKKPQEQKPRREQAVTYSVVTEVGCVSASKRPIRIKNMPGRTVPRLLKTLILFETVFLNKNWN